MIWKFLRKFLFLFLAMFVLVIWIYQSGILENSNRIEFLSVYEIVKDIATLTFAIITISLAFEGLETWNKEIKGKFIFDLAKESIILLEELRDQIHRIGVDWFLETEITLTDPLIKFLDEKPNAFQIPFDIIFQERLKQSSIGSVFIKLTSHKSKIKFFDDKELSTLFETLEVFYHDFLSTYQTAVFIIEEVKDKRISIIKLEPEGNSTWFLKLINHDFFIQSENDIVYRNYFDEYIEDFEKNFEKAYFLLLNKMNL